MMEVNVILGEEISELFPLDTRSLKQYAVHILEVNGVSDCDVNVVFIDDGMMTELNQKYKGKSGSTDVLSFGLSNEDSERLEGEVYVSLQRAREQAVEYDVPFAEEVARLVAHGLLHLVGRVHDTEKDYKAMIRHTEKFVENFFADGEKR